MSFKITSDILSEESTLEEFIKLYNLKTKAGDLETTFNEFINKLSKISKKTLLTIYPFDKTANLNENKSTIVSLDKVTIGDTVSISYYPDSQKYIEEYELKSRIGKVIYVDNNKDDLLIWSYDKNKSTYHFESLVVEGCSYFGHSRGYNYIIDKF